MLTQNKTLLNIQGPDFHSTLIFACLPLNYSWILACKMTFIYSFLFYWREFNKLAAQAWCAMETGALTMTQADDGFLDQLLCSVPMYSSHYPEVGHNWSILHLQMTYPNRKMQCQAVSALGMTAEPHSGLDITRDTGQSHTTLEKVQNPFATCSHWVCISFKKKVQEIDLIIGLISIQYDDFSEKHSLLPTSMPSLPFPVRCSLIFRTVSQI